MFLPPRCPSSHDLAALWWPLGDSALGALTGTKELKGRRRVPNNRGDKGVGTKASWLDEESLGLILPGNIKRTHRWVKKPAMKERGHRRRRREGLLLLLAFGDDKLHVADDGTINLSRRVVSVEHHGELKVSLAERYEEYEQVVRRDDIIFKPKYAGRSDGVLNVGA